ncbi:N-alpha-acetyltransferase 30-like [Varroa jacobsoni]|uniref:N-alpha-acetyltransferase 30-like n=1 Tax=Varroa jacobsoni TaxID=62625 RepID=UPI000BF7A862|nr:N-alpha-acetyltransferase 30-like [Varroa jacobsoni]
METVPVASAAVPVGVSQSSDSSSSGGSCSSTKNNNTSTSIDVRDCTTEGLSALLDATTLNGGNHHNSCYYNDAHNNHVSDCCSLAATSKRTAPQTPTTNATATSQSKSVECVNLRPQSAVVPCAPTTSRTNSGLAEHREHQQHQAHNDGTTFTTITDTTTESTTALTAGNDGPTSIPPPYPTMPFRVDGITYIAYESELQMPAMMELFQKDLSEPYSIYTYRYFIHNWPKLCFLAMDGDKCVGAIVCKLDAHKKRDSTAAADAVGGSQQSGSAHSRVQMRGYIAMLAVEADYRKRKIASNLVLTAIRAMVANRADEVVLETEITNQPALRLYENLGFVRDKRLFRYYLNGVDAFRLKLWLR